MSALDTTEESPEFNWVPYYDMIAGKSCSKQLLDALAIIENRSSTVNAVAYDLGCGEGRDTAELLRRHWRVVAIDSCAEGLERLRKRPEAETLKSHLETRLQSLSEAQWSDADLVIALLVLPYIHPKDFPAVWSKICASLKPGGYLVCTLFGDRHQWAQGSYISHFTREQARQLVSDFEVVKFAESGTKAQAADGSQIEAHWFDIVARKR